MKHFVACTQKIALDIRQNWSETMAERRGEKVGWTAGWCGGFIWVAILSVIFLFQEKWLQGLSGLLLVSAAVVIIISFAPWRHPSTHYWKLMIAPYVTFFASIAWAVWSYGGIKAIGFDWWTWLWLLPLLIPVGSLCQRRWSDFDSQQEAPADPNKPRR